LTEREGPRCAVAAAGIWALAAAIRRDVTSCDLLVGMTPPIGANPYKSLIAARHVAMLAAA
jgi:hypothetical protein